MHAHAIVRRIILAVASLVLVVVVYGLYQSRESSSWPTPQGTASPSIRPAATPPPPKATGATASATPPTPRSTAPGVPIGDEGVPIRGGEKVTIQRYAEDGRQVGEITVDEWHPIGEKGDEFEVIGPVIRLRTPQGQLVNISAQRGTMVLRSADQQSPEPRSGRLEGNVRIVVDRFSAAEREALPADRRDTLTDDRRIDLEMDSVAFDLEFSRLETAGPFRIRAAEAAVEGTGLSLRFDEVDNRIDNLVIEKGKAIEVRGLFAPLRVALTEPFTPPDASTSSQAAPLPDVAEGTAAEAPDQPGNVTPSPAASPDSPVEIVDLPADDVRPPRQDHIDIYDAVFDGDVQATQFEGEQQVGELLADRLAILFEFGQRERDMAWRSTPGAPPAGVDAGTDGAPTEAPAAGTAASAPEQRLRLTWTGKLLVQSRRSNEVPRPDRQRRVRLVASGERVQVSDDERRIHCRRLIYEQEKERVELYGSAEQPAEVESGALGLLQATQVVFDRSAQQATATGPGRLTAQQAVRFGGRSSREADLFKRLVSRDDTADRPADQLDISFGGSAQAFFTRLADEAGSPTDVAAPLRDALERAAFEGDVVMRHGSSRLLGQRVDVDFQRHEAGGLYPSRVEIAGGARAEEAERFIQAGEYLEADLTLAEVARAPFDPARAWVLAAASGHDPASVDWAAVEQAYAARREFRTEISHLLARGGVEVRDPEQKLEIDAHELDCRFLSGLQIASGLVTPAADVGAYVALDDFSIAAGVPIPFDAVAQTAEVAGPGRMSFPADRDLDGRRMSKPLVVNIKWTGRMSLSGSDNKALFVGNVRAQTSGTSLDCAEMRVDFTDAPAVSGRSAQVSGPSRWWILAPLLDSGPSPGAAAARLAGPDIRKDIAFVQALGGATAVTRNTTPDGERLSSRALLTGPTLVVDVPEHTMRIEGAGHLLIEDYRPRTADPTADPSAADRRVTPFGKLTRSEPSQTHVGWQQALTYRYDQNIAQFEQDVQLLHLTGSRMKLVDELRKQTELAESDLQAEGREASLRARSLVVRFLRNEQDDTSGAGRLSGNEVEAFNASGAVVFEDSGISAVAEQITYSRQDSLLQILGSDEAPAQLIDERKRFSALTGPKFYWDRQTNQIKAPKSRAIVR